MQTPSLKNQLLIAMPGLADPNFFHTVTYLCEHTDEGALGIVINRPLDVQLRELFDNMDVEVGEEGIGDLPVYLGGPLRGVESPIHYDFRHLRDTPGELRQRLAKLGWRKIVAFQTRNPMHRVHEELTKRAIEEVDGVLLLVEFKHGGVVHAVDVIAGQHQYIAGMAALQQEHVLVDRVRRACIPFPALAHLRRHGGDVFTQ